METGIKSTIERNGITYHVIPIPFDDIDNFISESPQYRPINFDYENHIVYVSDEIDQHRTYPVECKCHMCKEEHVLKVIQYDYEVMRLQQRKLAQDCFIYMNREERESLISGMCPKCQRIMFSANYED